MQTDDLIRAIAERSQSAFDHSGNRIVGCVAGGLGLEAGFVFGACYIGVLGEFIFFLGGFNLNLLGHRLSRGLL